MTQQVLDANDVEMWERIAAAATKRLEAQLSTALAADQRALVLAGLLATATAALATGAAICLIGTPPRAGLGYTAVAASIGLLISGALAVLAARPTEWFSPGSDPKSWKSDIATRRPRAEAMREYCDDLSDMIGKNQHTMSINGKLLMSAVILALATLATAVVTVASLTSA